MREANRSEWGCPCGRLCLPDDDDCESCDAPRAQGTELRTLSARNRFLRGAEKTDRRRLEGARGRLAAVETSYRETADAFDKHCRAMSAPLAPWLEGSPDEYGGDPLDVFYGNSLDAPWLWG